MPSIRKHFVGFLPCRKTPPEKPEDVKTISFRRLTKFATTANLLTFLLGCLCSAVGGIIQNLVLVFGGWMITTYMIHGKAFDEHLVEEIKPNLIFLLIFAVIQFVITFVENYCLAASAVNVVGKIRKEYLAAVLRQDSDWWESKAPGAITLELNDNIEVIKDGLGSKVGMMIRGVSMYVSSLIMCSIINWRLTLIFMPIGPVTAYTLGLTQKVYGKYSDEVNGFEQDAASILEEVVLNVKTVQLCNAQEHFVEKYRRKVSESLPAILKTNFWLGFIDGLTYLESVFIIGMFYWIAIPMYYETKLVKDPGDIILILNVLSVSCYCLSMLGYQMSAISKAWITASNVCETIDRPSSIDKTSVSPIKDLQGKITFSNVRFKYNSRTEETLRGLTLSAEPGQSIALVGESGCGKSTALQLLTRTYSPLSGEIEIDDVNLGKICPLSLRKSIGVVEQRSCLISGSIADNIRFGRENISDEAVEEAAKIANAHEFVAKLDKGYDTLVGEGALKLSGGQKQRIAIARAVLTNPKILLLDEATSALDTQSEKIVQNALNTASKGRTTVIIAHRLSTLKDVDKIYVLKEGVVAESGSHPELLKQDGIYASLARTQDVKTDPEESAIEKLPKKSIRQSSLRSSTKSCRRSFSIESANNSKEITYQNSGMLLLFHNLSTNLNVALPALFCSIIRGFDVPLMCLSVFLAFKSLENADHYKENMHYAIVEVVVAGILILLVQIMMYVLASCTAEKVLNSLKVKALRSLLYRPMAFFDTESPATCVVSIIQNAPTCKSALDTSMGMNIAGMTAVAIGLVVGLIYVWQISVLTAVWCTLLYILIFWNLHYSNLAQRMKSTKDKSAELAVELIENVRSVQLFAVEDYFVKKFGVEQRRAKALDQRIILIDAINFALTQSSIFFNEFSMNLMATYLVYYGYYDANTVFLGLECAQVSSWAVLMTAPFFPGIIKACSSSKALAEYVDEEKMIDERLKMGDKPEIDGAVNLENIKFAYPRRPDVLVTKNLTVRARKNEKIALVGPSGGGKSTVLNLLTKLYSPLSGSMTIDGIQVGGINNEHLRNNVAVVGQEPVLFKGTIKENITMGDEEIGMDMVEKACKTANALNFIDAFPEKFDTDVGEGGSKLSGGQRQRIAIARAIVKMPRILLLDEATAALDAESEEKVNSALSSAVTNITSITIAHRLKTVQQSDRIYVVENGRIVESGSHKELMENEGHYVALVKAQKLLNDE